MSAWICGSHLDTKLNFHETVLFKTVCFNSRNLENSLKMKIMCVIIEESVLYQNHIFKLRSCYIFLFVD